jgi:hypothetical protein
MRSYGLAVSIPKLFALLVALSVLFAPSVAAAAEHSMSMADRDMAMMEMGHCQAPPSGHSDHDKKGGSSCCISICMAVAIARTAPALESHFRAEQPNFFVPAEHEGNLGEIATPPPRIA